MRQDSITVPRTRIGSAGLAVAMLAGEFAGLGHEELRMLHLDESFGLIAVGSLRGGASVELPIRRLVREALALGTRAIVVAHNHPGGDPMPSRADRIATVRLAEALRPLRILLADHLVFGAANDWTSFHARGWL